MGLKIEILIILNFAIVITSSNYCSEYAPKCKCFDTLTLICDNFTTLKELNFTPTQLVFKYFVIQPVSPILFDHSFNISNLKFENNTIISLSNFNGFDIMTNPFKSIKYTGITVNLNLNQTQLNFYFNNKLIDSSSCSSKHLNSDIQPLFSAFDRLIFYESVAYPSKLCSKIFENSIINDLLIFNVNKLNRLSFMSPVEPLSLFKIDKLIFINSDVGELNSDLLDKYIFQYITSLSFINVYLSRIEMGLLREFKYLKSLALELTNFKEFIQDLSWFNDLNYAFKEILSYDSLNSLNITQRYKSSQMELLLSDVKMEYDYADDQFCLFKSFPHTQLVYPAISSKKSLNCTCSLIWLIQFYRMYANKDRLVTQSVEECIQDERMFNETIYKCGFRESLNKCSKFSEKNNVASEKKLETWELALIIALPMAIFILLIVLCHVLCHKKKTFAKV